MNCSVCGQVNANGAQFCNQCGTSLALPPVEQEAAPQNLRHVSRGFVGRRAEIQELLFALENVLSGKGRLVMLAGEPGIGKTRTAQELMGYAQARGAQVLWGRCYEGEGAPPYWPWVQSIRAYVQQEDPERLRSEMGPGAADISAILPEIREKLPNLAPTPNLEPDQAKFRLFDSVATFLKNAAQKRPLVLILDDLHWADRSSLLLLQFLSQQLGDSCLLVLGTYRDVEVGPQHPLSDTLAQLSREPVFRRQSLGGLSLADAGQFIENTAGVRPTQQLIDAVYTRTEGNPFFTAEVVRLLYQHGELREGDGPESLAIAMPAGVLEVIGRRLNRLSTQCHRTLTTGAVIGREFDFPLLSRLSEGISEDQLLDVIDEALEAHLIEELRDQRERYQFCHALIQETFTLQLSSSRKVRLHARIGQTLEGRYGTDTDAHGAELAHHFAEAQTLLGPEKLVKYSLLAGEQALAAYAWEDALAHFERGLVALDINLCGAEAAPDEEAAALLFGLARAQSATLQADQLVETFAILRRAFEYYAEAENIALAVAAAEFPIDPTGRSPGSAELMVRALALVPADSYESGRLLSRYGGILGLAQGDYEGAQQALGRALSIARREGDVALEVQTLTYAADVSGQHLHWQESVKHGLRAIALATGHENNYSAVLSRWWTSVSLLHMGDLERARPHALVLRDLAAKQSTPRSFSSLGFVPIVTLSCLEGNWKAGREYCNRVLKEAPSYQQLLSARVLLEYETGEFDQGKIYLERLLEAMRRGLSSFSFGKAPMTLIAVARITDVVDHLDIAESTAKALLSEPSVTPIVAMCHKAGLALLAVHTDNQFAASEHYAYFREHPSTMIWTLSSVDRLIGLLSQTMGNLNLASDHFEDALTFCRKTSIRPELAWTCHDYAKVLLQRSQPADRHKALSLLDESLSLSTELGMRPLMERVVGFQEQIQSGPRPRPVYPDNLTEREVEILRLVAAGKSNPEIAKELYISSRTVSTHISNILNKINATNRTEAASYANRHGMA